MTNTDLLKLSNQELAKRMLNYLTRIEDISQMISSHLNDKKRIDKNFVRNEYASIKTAIRDDAHFIALQRNEAHFDLPVKDRYKWAVEEASAYFDAPINCKDMHRIQMTLFEVEYKLTKHTDFQEWQTLCA